jgi:predicted GNAT family N-acyltransferase
MLPSVACIASDPLILAEISEFRGRILYANGRRPLFRREGGRYADEDLLDPRSFHITARRDGDLVGYVRIRPLPEHSQSSLGLMVTRRQFDAALEEMRLARNDCLEVSRWIVAPCARGTDVGATLVVGAWAVGRWLRKQRLIATVGTRDGQVRMLARFGGQTLNSVDAKFIGEYDDELVTMYFELNHPPPRVAAKLSEVEQLLNL